VIDQPLKDFHAPASRQARPEENGFQRALSDTAGTPVEQSLLTSDGQVIPTLLQVSPEMDETGRTVGALAAYLDITERKRTEEQVERALEENRALLQELYHRTKNNMQVICAMLQLQSAHLGNSRVSE
jgi:PAS domain-containing protein